MSTGAAVGSSGSAGSADASGAMRQVEPVLFAGSEWEHSRYQFWRAPTHGLLTSHKLPQGLEDNKAKARCVSMMGIARAPPGTPPPKVD